VIVQGRALSVGGRRSDLPDRERAVLDALLRRPGAVVSRSTMLRLLGDATTDRSLEAAVARLRRRLGAAGGAIRVVRGRGYAISATAVGVTPSGATAG
jgi:DNA-binding response OmpR family regulator